MQFLVSNFTGSLRLTCFSGGSLKNKTDRKFNFIMKKLTFEQIFFCVQLSRFGSLMERRIFVHLKAPIFGIKLSLLASFTISFLVSCQFQLVFKEKVQFRVQAQFVAKIVLTLAEKNSLCCRGPAGQICHVQESSFPQGEFWQFLPCRNAGLGTRQLFQLRDSDNMLSLSRGSVVACPALLP